jgi:hypothetical protein
MLPSLRRFMQQNNASIISRQEHQNNGCVIRQQDDLVLRLCLPFSVVLLIIGNATSPIRTILCKKSGQSPSQCVFMRRSSPFSSDLVHVEIFW